MLMTRDLNMKFSVVLSWVRADRPAVVLRNLKKFLNYVL